MPRPERLAHASLLAVSVGGLSGPLRSVGARRMAFRVRLSFRVRPERHRAAACASASCLLMATSFRAACHGHVTGTRTATGQLALSWGYRQRHQTDLGKPEHCLGRRGVLRGEPWFGSTGHATSLFGDFSLMPEREFPGSGTGHFGEP